jgi:hypothetical protein
MFGIVLWSEIDGLKAFWGYGEALFVGRGISQMWNQVGHHCACISSSSQSCYDPTAALNSSP